MLWQRRVDRQQERPRLEEIDQRAVARFYRLAGERREAEGRGRRRRSSSGVEQPARAFAVPREQWEVCVSGALRKVGLSKRKQ